MVAVVCHEMLPAAHRYDPGHAFVSHSFFAGMLLMAVSLVLFAAPQAQGLSE